MSKGEEVRFGELVTNMTTGALAMQWASASIIRNAVLGGAAGGTNTAVTNWMYGESEDVRNAVFKGVFFSGLGSSAGKIVTQWGAFCMGTPVTLVSGSIRGYQIFRPLLLPKRKKKNELEEPLESV